MEEKEKADNILNYNNDNEDPPRGFKKNSHSKEITLFLRKRDFFDHITEVDPIDGVVVVETDDLTDRKVYVTLTASYRYGPDEWDLGLRLRHDIYTDSKQIYPTEGEYKAPLTLFQKLLLDRKGSKAFPFCFIIPPNSPTSVTLQHARTGSEDNYGVKYELAACLTKPSSDVYRSKDAVRMVVRKLMCAPLSTAPQPSAEVTKEFLMSSGVLRLEASLDKERYYHGESMTVNLVVDNTTHKTVKKIKVSVIQSTDLKVMTSSPVKLTIDEVEYDQGIFPNQRGWCKDFCVCPLLCNNREKRGLALEGKLKQEETNLASSTFLKEEALSKECLAVIVQYYVKIRLIFGFGTSDVWVNLPFSLTHPPPPEHEPQSPSGMEEIEDEPSNDTQPDQTKGAYSNAGDHTAENHHVVETHQLL